MNFRCISESLSLIARTLQNDLVVPSWNQFCGRMREIYEKVSFFARFFYHVIKTFLFIV